MTQSYDRETLRPYDDGHYATLAFVRAVEEGRMTWEQVARLAMGRMYEWDLTELACDCGLLPDLSRQDVEEGPLSAS